MPPLTVGCIGSLRNKTANTLFPKEQFMAKVSSASVQSSSRSDPQDHDRRPIGSQILRNLPKEERAQILPLLEFVRLKLHQLLNEAGEVIRSAYFLNDGLGSVLTVQPDGKSVEVGLIGV